MGSRSGGGGVCVHKHDVTKRFDVLDIRNVGSITDLVTVSNEKKSENGKLWQNMYRGLERTLSTLENP